MGIALINLSFTKTHQITRRNKQFTTRETKKQTPRMTAALRFQEPTCDQNYGTRKNIKF